MDAYHSGGLGKSQFPLDQGGSLVCTGERILKKYLKYDENYIQFEPFSKSGYFERGFGKSGL
jgi:hypothetical protein